jgi:hypothetical protein
VEKSAKGRMLGAGKWWNGKGKKNLDTKMKSWRGRE